MAASDIVLALPSPLRRRVFQAVPVDARLRCIEVSPAWRAYLTGEDDLWRNIDLSNTSGVTSHVSDALLRAAAARAGGCLESLDLYHERLGNKPKAAAKDEAISVRMRALLAVLRANPTLKRVRLSILWLHMSEDPGLGFAPAFGHYQLDLVDLRRLCAAAPAGAVLEVDINVLLADHAFRMAVESSDGEGEYGEPGQLVPATYDELLLVLRREAPYQDVSLHALQTGRGLFRSDSDLRYRTLYTSVGLHQSLEHLSLYEHGIREVATLDALAEACCLLPRLRSISFIQAQSMPRDVPLLPFFTRLVSSCSELRTIEFDSWSVQDFFKGADVVSAFCEALRAAPSLERLKFKFGMISIQDVKQFEDAAAGEAVLAALRDMPTFSSLKINNAEHVFNTAA